MGAARVFFKWTPGESSGSTHKDKTKHLNPSPWQCYSLCWRMRPELKSSGEEKGVEGREKAVGLCVVVFEVLVAAVDASGCAALSSQCLPSPPMPC